MQFDRRQLALTEQCQLCTNHVAGGTRCVIVCLGVSRQLIGALCAACAPIGAERIANRERQYLRWTLLDASRKVVATGESGKRYSAAD